MPVWRKMARLSFVTAVFVAFAVGSAQAETLRLSARTIYDRAVSNNVVLSQDGSAIQLQSGEVFQDDGPASGFSYKPNSETLSPGIAIRKQILIPDPRTDKAVLMVGGSSDLRVEVNGHLQELRSPRKIFYGQWQAYDIDPAVFKPGITNSSSGAPARSISRAWMILTRNCRTGVRAAQMKVSPGA